MAGLFNSGKAVELPPPVKLTVAPVAQTAALRPVQQERGGNARALAEALGSLNGGLQRYVEVDHAIKENPESLANREWIARAQQMSMEDLQTLAQSGEADGIRVREDALNGLLGEKAVADARAEITETLNTSFDYQNGDAQGTIDEIITRHAEALPNDFSRAAFHRMMGGFRQANMDKVVEIKTTDARAQVSQAVVDSFRNIVDDAQSEGKSPEEVAGLLFERSASNRPYLGLSGQEQNETIIAIAEEAALRGDVDLVEALLNGDRKGAKGETLPALAKIAGNAPKAAKLLQMARDKQTELVSKDSYSRWDMVNTKLNEGSLTEADVKPMVDSNLMTPKMAADYVARAAAERQRQAAEEAKARQKLAFVQSHERQRAAVVSAASSELERYAGVVNIEDAEITSKSGDGFVKVTKDEAIKAAVARKEDALLDKREKLIKDGMSEADADLITNRDRVTFYAANGLDNHAWSIQFNGIASMVPPDLLAKGGAPSKQAMDTAELYMQIKQVNPAYAEDLVTDARARELFEAYDVERSVTRLPPDRALLSASLQVNQPEAQKARFRFKDEDKDAIARTVISDTGVDGIGGNYALVRGRIEQLSKLNLPKPVIEQRIKDWLTSSTVAVNGQLVQTGGRTPADFKPLAEGYLKGLYERVKDAEFLDDEDETDLYLVPTPGGGKWTVWSKSRRVPLPYTMTEADLTAGRKAEQKRRADEAAKAAAEAAEGRRKKRQDGLDLMDRAATIPAGSLMPGQ